MQHSDSYRRNPSTQQPPYNYSNILPSSIPIRPAPPHGHGYPTSPTLSYTSSSPSSSHSTSPTSPWSSSYPHSQPPSRYLHPFPLALSPLSILTPHHSGAGEYVCLWQGCSYSCTRNADLQRHYQNVHNREFATLVDCLVPACHRKGAYGFTRKDKMVDHVREVHKMDIPKRGCGGGKREGLLVVDGRKKMA